MWEIVESNGGEQHVKPIDDLRPHDTARECWCRPKEDDEDALILVHNALDRREFYERALARSS